MYLVLHTLSLLTDTVCIFSFSALNGLYLFSAFTLQAFSLSVHIRTLVLNRLLYAVHLLRHTEWLHQECCF